MPKTPELFLSSEESAVTVTGISVIRQREEAISGNVLRVLGRPAHLRRVTVIPLWDNYFRVNIVTGELASSVAIPNSFFITADDGGKILGSTPVLRNQY